MKKRAILASVLLFVLNGCSAPSEPTATPQTAPAITAPPQTVTPTPEAVPDSLPETVPVVTGTKQQIYKSTDPLFVSAYKTAIMYRLESYSGISYSLYDMDKDGIPELLLCCGTDFSGNTIEIYTIRNNQIASVGSGIDGTHTGFCYDYKANQLVLAFGIQGIGRMDWYDMDDKGKLRFLISTDQFICDHDGNPSYDEYMRKYNVAHLPSTEIGVHDGKATSYLHYYTADKWSYKESDGYDFSMLENYH